MEGLQLIFLIILASILVSFIRRLIVLEVKDWHKLFRNVKKWNSKREKYSQKDFLNYFINLGYDYKIINEFYNHIFLYLNYKELNLRPYDRLTIDYKIDSEDLFSGHPNCLLFEILSNLSIKLPNQETINIYEKKHKQEHWDTPANIIKFIHYCKDT